MLRITAFCLFLMAAMPVCARTASSSADNPHQNPTAVTDIVETYIRNLADASSDKIEIFIQTPRVSHLPACTQLQAHTPTQQRLRARLTVGVRCIAPHHWMVFAPVAIRLQGIYYVARRTLQPGDVITHDDLVAHSGDLLGLPHDAVLDAAQALNYAAAQRIPAGTSLSMRHLRDPVRIRRGQAVRTQAHGPGFTATSEGQALEEGKPGAQIKIRTKAGKIISGIVLDGHTVHVIL